MFIELNQIKNQTNLSDSKIELILHKSYKKQLIDNKNKFVKKQNNINAWNKELLKKWQPTHKQRFIRKSQSIHISYILFRQ